MLYRAIVVFDGMCNLCSQAVQFVIKRDPAGIFRFASIQSATGGQLLEVYGLDRRSVDTIVLIKEGRSYVGSDAALEIAKDLKGFWKVAASLKIVPRPIRDCAYSWIARNRYRWFGKRGKCLVPTAEIRSRFLE
jgi:predicted DCC family thiol-disulfide oxidoreductase YuxK